ncbi:hypothetical protein [Sorangium sp. So ce1151]|uniref:hypothetical protein n=1 Tax=Sorangium sp. So ce1151 TaxID=3133332 RepID=UPI003F648E15
MTRTMLRSTSTAALLSAALVALSACGDGGRSSGSTLGSGAGRAPAGDGGAGGIDTGATVSLRYADFTGACAYDTSDFARLESLGVRHVRMDQPSADKIELARQFGIEVLPIVDYGIPELSGQDDDKYPPLPEHRGAWAKRMVDVWRGMEEPPRVFEVWNEPWHENFWKPAPDAAAYLELVKAFADEAWAEWPEATLLVSAETESAPSGLFRDALLAADTTGFLNDPRILPTTHNYVEGRSPTQVTSQPCFWDLDRFACAYDAFKAHGHPDPQVWVTEFGWESDTPSGFHYLDTVSEQTQADYTREALQIFRDSGKVARAYSFMFRIDDPWNYNWLRPDGSQKPVCDTVKTLLATGE